MRSRLATILFFILLMSAHVLGRPMQKTPSPDENIEIKKREAAEQKEKLAAEYERAKALYAPGLAKKAPTDTSRLTALQSTVKGTFWRNPEWVTMLNLSVEQQKKMDDVFLQYRLKLIDLTASLDKEELILEPLWGPSRPTPENEAKILTQIDRIADARAELEKANSRMLLGVLGVLTTEQWSKLPIQSKKLYGPVLGGPAK